LNKNIKGFTKRALKLIYEYDWPGNIRELENTIERCIILSESNMIDIEDLPTHIKMTAGNPSISINGPIFSDDAQIIPFDKLKEEAIRHALKVTSGNIVEASKKLQIGRATFYRFLEKYKITTNEF
jgi:DNA-binding NtrC family response regulator